MLQKIILILPILLLTFTMLYIDSFAQYQYSQAEIDLAVRRLKQRGFLETFVNKTADDPKQVAIRADVLITSYQIIRELDRVRTSGRGPSNSQLELLQVAVNNLKLRLKSIEEQGVSTTDNTQLISSVFNELDTYLANNTTVKGMENSIKSLEKQDVTLDDRIRLIESRLEKLSLDENKDVNKKIRNSNIMAATGLLLTLVITILSAR